MTPLTKIRRHTSSVFMGQHFLTTLRHTIAFLLLALSTPLIAATDPHDAIMETFDATFGPSASAGIVIQSVDGGPMGVTLIGVDTTAANVCKLFTFAAPIDYAIVMYKDGRYRSTQCK